MKTSRSKTRIVVAAKRRRLPESTCFMAVYSCEGESPTFYGIPVDWFFPRWNDGDTFEITIRKIKK